MTDIPYDDLAQIRVNEMMMPFNKRRYEFEWVGENHMALIDPYRHGRDLPTTPGQQFWLGHLNLVVVEYYPWMRQILVALADGRAYQAMYAHRVRNWLIDIKCRLILTLYVWGLADRHEGYEISWSWVHWGRKK